MILMDLSHKPTNNVYMVSLNSLLIFQDAKNVKRYFKSLYDFFNKYSPNEKSSLNYFYRKILQNTKHNEKNSSIEDNIYTFPTNTPNRLKNNQVNQIYIMDYKDKMLKIDLNDYLTDIDAVQFYKKKIVPILNVSKYFNIDFTKKIPFEHFEDDDISEISDYSFTSYYKYLLNYCGIGVNEATTKEISDGKYEMKINDKLVIDIRAWDNLKNVVDNVETIKEQLHLENDLIIRPCYFFNVGVTFDINDFEKAYDVWGCNGNACKSDIINGLSCENYGINFNEEMTRSYIKEYVKRGCDNTYGYMIKRNIELSKEEWEEIDEELVKNYGYDDLEDAKQNGFIPFDFAQLEDCCSYYEQPDESYLKAGSNLLSNKINVYNKKIALEKNYNAVSKILKDIYDENVDSLEM